MSAAHKGVSRLLTAPDGTSTLKFTLPFKNYHALLAFALLGHITYTTTRDSRSPPSQLPSS